MCEYSSAFSSAFAICVQTQPIRRVIITPPRVRAIRAQVRSEIDVVSTVAPHVEQRFADVPSRVVSAILLEVRGSAVAHVLRRGVAGSSADLATVGSMRASIDNDAEVLAMALGVSFEMAQELV